MESIEKLAELLSNQGLKETADIARHSDDVDSFISYMEFDIEERKQALEIAKNLQK